jgi:hypothetical protein
VEHPLLVHVVRRLVWLLNDGTSIRVAEDRTFADADDSAVTLPAEATVSVAHPLLLGPGLATWAQLFADYGIAQPFPQLSREVYEPSAGERDGALLRFVGRTVPTVRVLGLERRGWWRETADDTAVQTSLSRKLPDGTTATLELDPGISVVAMNDAPEQKVVSVVVDGGAGPVGLSEVIRDVEAVTG